MKNKFWIRPQMYQKVWAIIVELLALSLPFIELDTSETITPLFVVGIMIYTICASILPAYVFFTHKYLLFDMYPLRFAEYLQAEGKLGRHARQDLERCGVQFDYDEDGWFISGYDAPK